MNYKEYKQALKNTFSISPCYKIEILDEMENPKEEITSDIIPSGSNISVKTNNGIRRTATLVLYNGHNKYKIQPGHIFYGTKINLYAGVSSEKGDYYEQLGVFYIQQISKSNSPADKNLTLTLVDKWAKLDGTVYGKVPSKLAFNKSATTYKEDSPLFTIPNGKTISSAAMKATDFILGGARRVSFIEANDGYNNRISFTGSPNDFILFSTLTTNFTLNKCKFSFKGCEGSGSLIIILQDNNKAMTFSFTVGDTSSIVFKTSDNQVSKKVEYNENLFNSDKVIDFIISNDSVQLRYGGEEAFLEDNFLNNFTISFNSFSSTIKELIMIGSYVRYYDYNMYDIIRSTLRKSCRYDVKIIDYLPSTVLNFNPNNENDRETINTLLDTRIGLYTIKANYDFIQLSSNNKIFKCISNNWNEDKGQYDPQWEEYFINVDDILDNSEPILDAYYEPIYEGNYVKVPNSPELYSRESLPYGLLTLPKSLTQEEGGTEAQILTSIAELLSAEIGYNRYGNFTLKPADREVDHSKQEIIWRFKKDDYYFGSTENINYSNLINYVVVTGTTSDNISLTESAGNYDLESEYCIQKIGVLPYIYKVAYTYNLSDWIPESAKDLSEEEQNAAANEAVKQNMRELAEWYLKRNNSLQTAVEISCYMIPHMEENKIIELENEDGVYNKYVVNSFSIPLDYSGTMTISCTKVG